MTTIHVDADTVARLGETLRAVADALESTPDTSVDRWAMGPGETGSALDDLVGNWRHQRLLLARCLRDLGERAKVAGGLYVDTEASVAGRFTGGGPTR
ncbi:MAG TPA: hypothetical protein VES95_13140 [Dermatophilaceae bacterium]|nr:hypothetical protein [Dermatophilaceae bacterium]